ncbi:phosphoribosyltransferase family protein [Psychroserpens sp. NJDZ02]|uniref:phosphoribosyltransferase family protein n=1 Tax=Psychroserpens sp. NJDZ02 TaxID=2570561 RepID=UPI0010A8C099|nr:phosphoribosyltransferase family protein [Psychroserpens sp. NJDZ02]QCE40000.1 phosphoribosyltransferase [Psychroserpens sp. NJDZ02]
MSNNSTSELKDIILDSNAINNKLRRIAFQIYEANINEKDIILAGIDANGYILAKKLKTILSKISPITPILCKITIDKKNPRLPIKTSIQPEDYQNKSVVLIDDVLNSGTTLIYCVKHFLNVPLKQFKTAVLVNRNHKKFPVKADYKGISLSTSLHEHVQVDLEGKDWKAYLN